MTTAKIERQDKLGQLLEYTDLLADNGAYYMAIGKFAEKNGLKVLPEGENYKIADQLRQLTKASVEASLQHKTEAEKTEQRDYYMKANYEHNTSSLKFENKDGVVYAYGDQKYNDISANLAEHLLVNIYDKAVDLGKQLTAKSPNPQITIVNDAEAVKEKNEQQVQQ